jgi:hypothetical protein
MATNSEWVTAYTRQADADLKTWKELEALPAVPACHRLLFLQMACEKLCKAHLIQAGTATEALQSSHAYVAKPLPVVIREQIDFLGHDPRRAAPVIHVVRHLANEIEIANPSCNREGRRADNCEYPWENGNRVLHSPLDWTFAPLALADATPRTDFFEVGSGSD